MFDKWRKYSYVAQKQRRLYFLKILAWLFASFLCFTLIGTLFISTIVVENSTMEPGILEGDRFVVSPFPYGARLPLFSFRLPGPDQPARGDLVVVDRSAARESNVLRFVDSLVRFFSGQRAALSRGAASASLKRVVGLPGDTVSMQGHILRVRPAGEPYALTEFELAKRTYDVNVPKLPAGWSAVLPFSDALPPLTLGAGEYFLVSDDRSAANDSRVWGAVKIDDIGAKVLFRYWPFSRFGRPSL